jgi:hypothetical protein
MRFACPAALAALSLSAALAALSPAAALAQSGPPSPGAPRVAKASIAEGVSKSAPVNGVLVLYGNERCPTNQNGEEVVVCVRRSAEEQYRIPKELRNFEVTPENASWAVKEQADRDVGNVGTGSCSTVGPGGQTGCFVQEARRAKAEARARTEAATPDLP